jgi:ppGpp synthetase/RelA/SpoT-type nucleotidyltranferase
VEQRLRREFRAAALPVLLSARAKHPEDLREKLRRRIQEGDPRYKFDPLMNNINNIVTDVAGCRVIVYDPRLETPAALVVQRAFFLDQSTNEVHRKPSGYRATHLLVSLLQAEVDLSIRDAVCEVQVTSIASHVFNELEHDIWYKMKGVEPGREVDGSKKTIDDAETLRFAIERIFERPISGEVEKLFRLLERSTDPLTAHAIEKLDLPRAAARGSARSMSRGYPPDDVVEIALGLLETFREEFRAIASSWRGPQTLLKRAILQEDRS